jgi:transketolase
VEALFVVLANKDFFRRRFEYALQIPVALYRASNKKSKGIEQNTGSLGHGLPISVGTALAAKMDKKDYKVYTLLGDGELPEGSNWEAALSASQYKLDNLCAIVDKNGLQISGTTAAVCNTIRWIKNLKVLDGPSKQLTGMI